MGLNFPSEPASQIYESIHGCYKAEDIENHILKPIARALRAKSASFVQFFVDPMGEAAFGLNFYIGRYPAVMTAFFKKFYPQCPWTQSVTKRLRENAHLDELIFADSFPNFVERDWKWRENFLANYGIGHFAGALLPISLPFETHVACVAFHRPHEDPAFIAEEIEYIGRVGLAIKPTLHMMACAQAKITSQIVESAYEKMGATSGFLILDEDLMVRHANARGLHYANASNSHTAGSELLGEIRQNLLTSSQTSNTRFVFESEEIGPVDVDISSIVAPDGRVFHLVLTHGSERYRSVDNYCRRYGLTSRERDVVEGLAAGKHTAEFSRDLGISLRTGENHLRSIYRKVGVNSRNQLVAKMYLPHI